MGRRRRPAGPIPLPVLVLPAPPVLLTGLGLPAGLVLLTGPVRPAGLALPAWRARLGRGLGRGNGRTALVGGAIGTR